MNTEIDISPGRVAVLSGMVRETVSGVLSSWFGPYNPLAPVAPKDTPVRRLDYPVGYNISITPRQGEPVSFEQMRALADNYDLVRLAIETRKDQMVKMPWSFRLRRLPGQTRKQIAEASQGDSRIAELTEFFQAPDRENTFTAWARLLLEDLMVVDAPAIAPRKTRAGRMYSLDVIDGATIKRVIDSEGRTPAPPDVAYQQILKGMPAKDLTADDLIYRPRNIRPHKFYGYSPVEQIIITINIGLRRQLQLTDWFDAGNIPAGYLGVPDSWTPEQIELAQKQFDAYLGGNLENRSKIIFGPQGMLQILKQPELKTEFDEWIARVVCYAFSLPPNAFVRQMNRATAETAQETALQEGLHPLLVWFKETIDYIVWRYWGYGDLEFAWASEREDSPKDQAETLTILVKNGLKTPNEARQALGDDPSNDPMADKLGVITAGGFVPLSQPAALTPAVANQPSPTTVIPSEALGRVEGAR